MKPGVAIAVFAVVAVLVTAGAPFLGATSVDLQAALDPETVDYTVLWRLRVPRVLTAFAAGAALAIGGMAFQALFRNPLATPFTLGVSSGASLGAAIAVRLGIGFSILGISSVSVFAFLGALFAVGVVYGLTRARPGSTTATMLLAGVAASFFFSSLILFIQYTSEFYNAFRLLRWLMGGLSVVGFAPFLNMLPFVIAGVAILSLLTHELNLLTTGEDLATSRGVDVPRVKATIFFVTSLMIGGVVATCGPIGFVGMMAPHICRMIVGSNHRVLAPCSILFGGAFLTLCDTFARTILGAAELPVGVVTALLGGPFFIWLLLSGTAERNLA